MNKTDYLIQKITEKRCQDFNEINLPKLKSV